MRDGGPTRSRPRLAATVAGVAENLDTLIDVFDGLVELQHGSAATESAVYALHLKIAEMLRAERETLAVVVKALAERRAKRRACGSTEAHDWLRRQLNTLDGGGRQ